MTSYNLQRMEGYFQKERQDILDLIPKDTHRLLSIGCAAGLTEAFLKEHLDIDQVVGVEIESSIASIAAGRLDAVHVGDIENIELPYSPGYFDTVLCLDVLEHLRNPWQVLSEKINPLTSPDGILIVSLPNVRYWVVLWKLFRGEWAYARRGVLDIGHLRFFTVRTAQDLIADSGFIVARVAYRYQHYDSLQDNPSNRLIGALLYPFGLLVNRTPILDSMIPFREFFAYQFMIVAHKA